MDPFAQHFYEVSRTKSYLKKDQSTAKAASSCIFGGDSVSPGAGLAMNILAALILLN